MAEQFYEIINLSNQKVLAYRAKIAASIWQRMKGLLGRQELKKGEALIIPDSGSIHTFFMKFSIDLVFLDSQGKVLKIAQNVSPWRLVLAPLRSRNVIELPAGITAEQGLEEGQKVQWLEEKRGQAEL